ncbi:DUF3717 domain-containing protein [Inhella gelatinilytica]|uniref:DUF3717 domain-containing protein n=1 Tax=Inhella gelatinilytica TaxID=2795030 RepID=A0A931IY60_9BURK|nr:DUF3717 domain-containing protein [Inhella gelatinilytica]MBH9553766.1 DUF3717 domain-containing protein [Inhella gelatinilytica]
MATLHISDLELAINWWRERQPSPDGISACAQVRALAEVYALMVYHHDAQWDEQLLQGAARAAFLDWYGSTQDSPCIAICSTTQGDALCKGCGRTFEEVKHWTELGAFEKRAVWRRILREGTAWRFNRYAERVAGSTPAEDPKS